VTSPPCRLSASVVGCTTFCDRDTGLLDFSVVFDDIASPSIAFTGMVCRGMAEWAVKIHAACDPWRTVELLAPLALVGALRGFVAAF